MTVFYTICVYRTIRVRYIRTMHVYAFNHTYMIWQFIPYAYMVILRLQRHKARHKDTIQVPQKALLTCCCYIIGLRCLKWEHGCSPNSLLYKSLQQLPSPKDRYTLIEQSLSYSNGAFKYSITAVKSSKIIENLIKLNHSI